MVRGSTTATTPFTPAATSLARAFDAAESTAPVSVTVALRVSTLMDCDRRAGSEANAVLTGLKKERRARGAGASPPATQRASSISTQRGVPASGGHPIAP